MFIDILGLFMFFFGLFYIGKISTISFSIVIALNMLVVSYIMKDLFKDYYHHSQLLF